MRKIALLFCISSFLCMQSHAQFAISKRFGKNAYNSKLGYGGFIGYEIPLAMENKSITADVDFMYFPNKSNDRSIENPAGFVSIKAGYKHIFSETRTGFFVQPQAGWCKVVASKSVGDAVAVNGIAAAMVTGYSLEVGDRGNTLNFGLKFESDLAGADYNVHSLSLRVSYSFGLFKKSDY